MAAVAQLECQAPSASVERGEVRARGKTRLMQGGRVAPGTSCCAQRSGSGGRQGARSRSRAPCPTPGRRWRRRPCSSRLRRRPSPRTTCWRRRAASSRPAGRAPAARRRISERPHANYPSKLRPAVTAMPRRCAHEGAAASGGGRGGRRAEAHHEAHLAHAGVLPHGVGGLVGGGGGRGRAGVDGGSDELRPRDLRGAAMRHLHARQLAITLGVPHRTPHIPVQKHPLRSLFCGPHGTRSAASRLSRGAGRCVAAPPITATTSQCPRTARSTALHLVAAQELTAFETIRGYACRIDVSECEKR